MRVTIYLVLLLLLLSASPATAGVDRWTGFGLPGEIYQILPSPTYPQGLWAATSGGLYWSPNAGGQWYPMEGKVRPWTYPPREIAVEPVAGQDVVYANFTVYSDTSLFRYEPSGDWVPIGGPRFQPMGVPAVGTGQPATLYLSAYRPRSHTTAVFRSTDRGESWKRILGGSPTIVPDLKTPGRLYAITDQWGILRSDDDGTTWKRATPPATTSTYFRIRALDISVTQPNRLAARDNGGVIFISHDAGESWQTAAPLPVEQCEDQGGGTAWLFVDPQREALFVRCPLGLMLATFDDGRSWLQVGADLPVFIWNRALTSLPGPPALLFTGSDEGVYRSRNGGLSWVPSSTGLRNSHLNPNLEPHDPNTLYAVSGNRILKSSDAGNSWQRLPPGPWSRLLALTLDPTDLKHCYVCALGGLYQSLDAGSTWSFLSPQTCNDLVVDPRHPQNLVASSQGLYRSTDGGVSWVETLRVEIRDSVASFYRLRVAPGNPDIIFVNGATYTFIHPDPLEYRSTDGGVTWQETEFFDRLNITADDPPVLFDYGPESTAVSYDLGDSWSNAGFPGNYPFLVLSEPATFYVFEADTALRSRDGGTTWKAIDTWNTEYVPPSTVLFAHPKRPERVLANTTYAGLLTGTFTSSPAAQLGPLARFEVHVAWTATDGRPNAAHVIPLGPNAAAFWFQGRPLPDLAIKIIPGTDGFYRVFQAGLSHLEHEVTVVDSASGVIFDDLKPYGRVRSSVRSPVFPPATEQAPTMADDDFSPGFSLSVSSTAPNTDLPLLGGRFTASIQWRRPNGSSGQGQAVALQDGAGWFWFFSDDNPEVILKMIDGRAHNGHFWVYTGALTNLEYTLTVTDQETGTVRRYFAAQGEVQSIVDTSAFAG